MSESDFDTPRVTIIYPPGDTARGIEDALAGGGISAVSCADVFRAVAAFTAHPTELVLLGLAHLDERDLEVLRVLRELRPSVYILVSFPPDRREAAVRALSLGADAYLLEPFYMGEMFALVQRGLLRAAEPSTGSPEAVAGEGLERLAGAVAHAINNSLQIIELLLADGAKEGPRPKDLRKETARIKEVVDELLSFSRRTDHHPHPFSINDLIEQRLPTSRCKKRRVELALSPELPEVNGDERGLGFALEAFLNLQTAKDGPHRLILTTTEDRTAVPPVELRFTVPDLHMSQDERDSLFLPFDGPLGGAVGLASVTAVSIVRAHGGTVRVQSHEEEGSTVCVRLPAAIAAPMEEGGRDNAREGG